MHTAAMHLLTHNLSQLVMQRRIRLSHDQTIGSVMSDVQRRIRLSHNQTIGSVMNDVYINMTKCTISLKC